MSINARRDAILVVALAGAAAAASSAYAQSFTGLGTLPGDTQTLGFGISADGTTVVGASGSNNYYHHAFRWRASTGMVSIGVGENFAFAHACNADGTVVCGVGDPDGTGNSAFRWSESGGMVRLSTLAGWGYSDSYSVSQDGSVVSGYCYDSSSGKRAVRWTNAGSGGGVMQDLGTLPNICGAPFSQGYGGVSADGTVISGDGTASGCSGHAWRWVDNGSGGTMQDLGHLPGQYATDSLSFGLSGDGLVVVGQSQAADADQAFRWTSAGGMQNIGILLTGGSEVSEADATNSDGSTVVGYYYSPAADSLHAFLWTTTLGAVDLNDYLPTLGIDLTGWNLMYAQAISADGKTIAGRAEHNGVNEAWVASLGSSCYPNCDGSTAPPILNANDFQCFLNKFAGGDTYANCDGSTAIPVLNANDFQCFLNKYAAGCS